MEINENKLKCFITLLMRDYLPTGDVAKLIYLTNEHGDDLEFSSKNIEAYAKELVERLK